MIACKVRGIYTTALTMLVARAGGFEITSPSREIASRLNLPVSFKPADMTVFDRNDLNGFVVEAKVALLEDPRNPFASGKIPGAAASMGFPNKYAIYKGRVIKHNEKYRFNHVLIEDNGRRVVAMLPESSLREQTRVIVQVQEPGSHSGKRKPVVSRNLSCPGQFAVLVPDRRVMHSRNITDVGLKTELGEIAASIPGLLEHTGVVFRSSCNDAFLPDVKRELEELAGIMDRVREAIDAHEGHSGLVIDPFSMNQVNVLLSKESLDFLDRARRDRVFTMNDHHYWRTVTEMGGDQHLVDFAEEAMDGHPELATTVTRAFTNYVRARFGFPKPGELVHILHYKPNGDLFKLKPGTVMDVFHSSGNMEGNQEHCTSLVLKRVFTPQPWHKSFYDGFEGLDIQPGDYSTCHAREGFPVMTNKYYRADGTFLGCYYNISTPVLLFPGEIRYIDLEIDVVENEAGRRKVIDRDKLDRAVDAGHVNVDAGKAALDLAERIAAGGLNDDLSCDDSFF